MNRILTFLANFTTFSNNLAQAVSVMGTEKLGVGLCTCCGGKELSEQEVAQRFQLIEKYGVQVCA